MELVPIKGHRCAADVGPALTTWKVFFAEGEAMADSEVELAVILNGLDFEEEEEDDAEIWSQDDWETVRLMLEKKKKFKWCVWTPEPCDPFLSVLTILSVN